jgi:hypothetical protein
MQTAAESAAPNRRRTLIGRVGLAAMTTARIVLGLGMVPYGLNKLLDYQFQVQAWKYARPLGEAAGTTLTWAFLGYHPHFQILLGILELIPAFLLFFARTRRIGALLMFPVLLNVVLINFYLNLWHDTQIISSVLLAIDIFLIAYDWRLYLGMAAKLLAPPAPIAGKKLRLTAKIAGFLIPATAITAFAIFNDKEIRQQEVPITDFIGVRQINSAGSWKIVSLNIAGQPVPLADTADLYFDFTMACVSADFIHPTAHGTFKADKSQHTFEVAKIPFAGSSDTITGTYQVQGNRMILSGTRDNQPVSIVLERDHWGRML